MLPDGSLPGNTKLELVTRLVAAFPTPADLEVLTEFYLGRRLTTVAAAWTDQRSLVLAVVNWCQTQGGDTLDRLVQGAVEERPQRADLRALAVRLGYLAADPPP